MALSWDWKHMFLVCERMLNNIKGCNRHAVKAALAEQLDLHILMYWMAHHFCRLLQGLKKERPAASREDILWNILDRWGFPIVPWMGQALKASLCKLDHGLVMLLGIKLTNGEPFDPLVHIDLEGCTVTIDTWATNKTMYNYSSMDWEPLRRLISLVPLSHSYWDVDPTLGDEVWKGAWDHHHACCTAISSLQNVAGVPRSLVVWGSRDCGI
ncbi:uncharacterized protein TrAtP1_002726 [Trichoderma atroviride]|uniref:uncharacterized protein n=1 Tax=Hypocrea atroviridis TaxID=63577 RepID=UPI0033167709|nr:hypothetical protein TrAtP1_002726 [Trichoderma atroviride]